MQLNFELRGLARIFPPDGNFIGRFFVTAKRRRTCFTSEQHLAHEVASGTLPKIQVLRHLVGRVPISEQDWLGDWELNLDVCNLHNAAWVLFGQMCFSSSSNFYGSGASSNADLQGRTWTAAAACWWMTQLKKHAQTRKMHMFPPISHTRKPKLESLCFFLSRGSGAHTLATLVRVVIELP